MQLTIETKGMPEATLRKLNQRLGDKTKVHDAIATAALPVVKSKLDQNASTNRNKFGARGGFWNRMKVGTLPLATAEQATIRMPREMNLRVYGGTVTPKKSKYLAIPATKEAYGKSPRDFADLRFAPLFGKGNGGALIQREQRRISYKRDGSVARGRKVEELKVFFWLKPSVTVNGDRSLIPTQAELMPPVLASLKAYLKLDVPSGGQTA